MDKLGGFYKPPVLLIDSDSAYRQVMEDLLREHLNLKFATSLSEAREYLRQYEFSMVISDINIPDATILEVLQTFKKVNPNIYFVVITATNDTQLAVDVMRNGAIDYILKPFAIEDIANLVDKYLKFSVNKKFDYDLINILTEEKRSFILPTNIHMINAFIYEFLEMIKRFKGLSKNDFFSIRLAAYEMLINAIEHGNLEIDYDKKKKLLSTGINYLDYLDKLSKSSPYQNRCITMTYHYTADFLKISVKDEGKGFNVGQFESRNIKDDLLALHGRGIIITKFNMDDIQYNSIGNEVTLTKYINNNSN